MSIFKDQPIHCPNCGKAFMGEPREAFPKLCSPECSADWRWKHALYTMGKEYRPRE